MTRGIRSDKLVPMNYSDTQMDNEPEFDEYDHEAAIEDAHDQSR